MSFLRNFVQENVSKWELSKFMKKLIHLRWMEVNRQMLCFQQFVQMSANFGRSQDFKSLPF